MNDLDTKPDEINLELKRTYFGGGANAGAKNRNRNHKGKKGPYRSNPSSKRKLLLTAASLSLLIVLAALLFIFYPEITARDKAAGNVPEERSTSPGEKDIPAARPQPAAQDFVPMVPAIPADGYETLLFDFEENEQGWDIPAWALNLRDHVALSAEISDDRASHGTSSLEVRVDFPKDKWSAALVELQQFLNMENFEMISVDIFNPERSKVLKGMIILTQGEDWEFNEMSRPFRLDPGEWTTVYADISENSLDWRRKKIGPHFRKDIRKIAVRIESSRNRYRGPVYIDNIKLHEDRTDFMNSL
jgi:hypothetical protein